MGNTKDGTLKSKKSYNEYTVMLVGRMGAGKSSLGNFLLKKDDFKVSDSLGRVTEKNMCQCTSLPGGVTLRVIDTPGFGDFRESEEVKRDLADAFYEAKDGVDAFIFVISAAERIGRELVGQFEMFKKFMDHDHFYDYVIPVFTKVDTKLEKRDPTNVYSYEKQERLIYEELKNEQLKEFNEKILKQANENWLCISNNAKDEIYYKHIVEKLISTIEKIRMKKNGMVCTSLIMTKAQDITEMERDKNKKAEEEQIKRMVVAMLLHIIINNMQGDEFDEIFGDDNERQKKAAEKQKKRIPKDSDPNQTAATGTAEDLVSKEPDLVVLPN